MQVNPLKEQSIKAKEYLDKKEELESIEVGYLTHEININYSLKQNREIIEKLDVEILNLNVFSNNDDTASLKLKENVAKLSNDINLLNQNYLV